MLICWKSLWNNFKQSRAKMGIFWSLVISYGTSRIQVWLSSKIGIFQYIWKQSFLRYIFQYPRVLKCIPVFSSIFHYRWPACKENSRTNLPTNQILSNFSIFFPDNFLIPTPIFTKICSEECPSTPETLRWTLADFRRVLTDTALYSQVHKGYAYSRYLLRKTTILEKNNKISTNVLE